MAIPERPLAALLIALALVVGSPTPAAGEATVTLRIAAINDFHGHLHPSAEPVALRAADGSFVSATRAGGVAKLATVVERIRAKGRHFAFVSAGDLVGATPALSALFSDEPTIDAMNAAGLDFNAVGNHELDAGVEQLARLQRGGCPAAGCRSGAQFGGARFGFLAANVFVTATGATLFPAYGVRDYGGIKVAFVGVALKGTPAISSPRNVAGLEFRDEADSVNALVPEIRKRGIEAIVVVIHQGGITRGGPNACVDFAGPIRELVARFDRAVDLVVSGHTHQAYVCDIGGRLVTGAGAFGRFVTEIELAIDSRTRDVVAAKAVNHLVTPDTAADAGVAAVVERYAKLGTSLDAVVGRISAAFSRALSADGESTLGRMIADAHLAAGRSAGAVVAFMNPGGIRAPLALRGAGEVTHADVFDVYPFDNVVVTVTLTGAQILEFLEAQWRGEFPRVMQVSSGFSYAWNPAAPVGARVVRNSVMLGGEALREDRTYRVALNSFLAQGGDGMRMLREGIDPVASIGGREAIARYIEQRSPLAPSFERRIRRLTGE